MNIRLQSSDYGLIQVNQKDGFGSRLPVKAQAIALAGPPAVVCA